MRAAASLFALAAVAPVALAGPFFTSPVAGTVCHGGQTCTVTWQDDGKAPSLADFGDCSVGVYAGNSQQQTMLQQLSMANAATTGSMIFTVDPNMGQNHDGYFIKMISVNTPDPTMPQYKATAYSAMFTLDGMTGTFNQTVKDQIAGASTSPGASAPPATSAAPATTPAASGSSAVVTTKATASQTKSASASGTATPNSANSVAVAGMGAFGAAAVAVLAAFL